jgi:hypothetical protein
MLAYGLCMSICHCTYSISFIELESKFEVKVLTSTYGLSSKGNQARRPETALAHQTSTGAICFLIALLGEFKYETTILRSHASNPFLRPRLVSCVLAWQFLQVHMPANFHGYYHGLPRPSQ